MNTKRPNLLSGPGRCRRRRQAGFTFLEAGLGMLILVLGAVLSGMVIRKIKHRTQCDALIGELRVLSTAFANYHQKHASWPPASSEIASPAKLESYLKDTNWLKGTPVGGNYRWVAPDPNRDRGMEPEPIRAGSGAIAVTAFSPSFPLTLSRADLAYIDAQIDDGNLATGRFRTGFNGWPIFLVKDDR